MFVNRQTVSRKVVLVLEPLGTNAASEPRLLAATSHVSVHGRSVGVDPAAHLAREHYGHLIPRT